MSTKLLFLIFDIRVFSLLVFCTPFGYKVYCYPSELLLNIFQFHPGIIVFSFNTINKLIMLDIPTSIWCIAIGVGLTATVDLVDVVHRESLCTWSSQN